MSFNNDERNNSESSNNNDNSREKQSITLENNIKPESTKKEEQLFLNFSFFKVDSKWRWLNEIGKE